MAAGLKIHALAVDPLSQDGFVTSPWLHLAMLEVELLMGLWLISGFEARKAWRVALVLFLGLSAISLYQGLTGQASCGCFGKVQVNPWITFSVDTAAVVLLFRFKPCPTVVIPADNPTNALSQLFSFSGQTSIAVIVLLTLVATGFLLFSDDPALALAKIRGETLCVDPSVVDVGTGEEGATRLVPVSLYNYGHLPVQVQGGNVSCVCMTLNDLPVTVPAKSRVTVHIEVKFKGTAGRFTHSFKFFHAGNEQSAVGRFTGIVSPSKQALGLTTASK